MASNLQVEISHSGETVIVKLIGEARLDVEGVQSQLDRIIVHRPKLVIVDMSELSFMSSLGMGMLVALRRNIVKSGGAVRLAGIQPLVATALAHAQLLELFEVHPDMVSATA